jgi:transposase
LLAADLPVRQVNPFKLRKFARASGVLAKNDPLDARTIASFVAIMPTRPAQLQAPQRLAEMLAVRRQLSAEKIAVENASRLLEEAMLRAPFSPHRSAVPRDTAGLKAAGKPPKVGIVAVMRYHQGALDAAG